MKWFRDVYQCISIDFRCEFGCSMCMYAGRCVEMSFLKISLSPSKIKNTNQMKCNVGIRYNNNYYKIKSQCDFVT